jgi:hypothetical protein
MRNLSVVLALAALLCAAAVSQAAAQAAPEPAAAKAEEVARDYLLALRKDGFAATADFMHPEDLARFQAMLLPAFEAEARAGSRALINATFGPGATLTDVRQSHPADFMRHCARVMAARMPRQPATFDEAVVLGALADNGLEHVLLRTTSGSGSSAVEHLVVVTLRPYEGSWKVAMSGDLEDAARSLSGPARPWARSPGEEIRDPRLPRPGADEEPAELRDPAALR